MNHFLESGSSVEVLLDSPSPSYFMVHPMFKWRSTREASMQWTDYVVMVSCFPISYCKIYKLCCEERCGQELHRVLVSSQMGVRNWNLWRGSSAPVLTYAKLILLSSGTQLFAFDTEEMRDSFSVSRWPLRKALLYDCEKFIKFGKTFQRYERLRSNAIKIHFEDGTTEECDLLIGADGATSKVKKQLIPEAKVVETDLAVIYFKIPYTPDTKDLLPTISHSMVVSYFKQQLNMLKRADFHSKQPELRRTYLDQSKENVANEIRR